MEKLNMPVLLVYIGFALLPFVHIIAYYLEIRKLKIYEGHTTGKVVEIREYIYYPRLFTKATIYYLTYEYNVDEITYRLEVGWGTRNMLRYPLGTEVEIYYDKKCPQKFTVGGEEKEHWKHAIYRMMAISAIMWFAVIYCFMNGKFMRR